jgi:hypothetical protein
MTVGAAVAVTAVNDLCATSAAKASIKAGRRLMVSVRSYDQKSSHAYMSS